MTEVTDDTAADDESDTAEDTTDTDTEELEMSEDTADTSADDEADTAEDTSDTNVDELEMTEETDDTSADDEADTTEDTADTDSEEPEITEDTADTSADDEADTAEDTADTNGEEPEITEDTADTSADDEADTVGNTADTDGEKPEITEDTADTSADDEADTVENTADTDGEKPEITEDTADTSADDEADTAEDTADTDGEESDIADRENGSTETRSKHNFKDWINPQNYDEDGHYIGEKQDFGYKPHIDGQEVDTSTYKDYVEQQAVSSVSEYMNKHGYGRDDFATYSQDPEWRNLMRKEYPNYELPQLTQESAKSQLSDYMNEHNYGQDDFATYSQDPQWRELQKAAYPDYELPPRNNADNLGKWSDISSDITAKENLDAVNPKYYEGDEWTVNCQRCVPTFEMRSRGYDVTSEPNFNYDTYDYLSYHPYDVWEGADVKQTSGSGLQDIETQMKEWGDGSRTQICVQWEKGDGGHTFIAEQKNGETHFLDPQTGSEDVRKYFNNVVDNQTTFCRIDNLQPSQRILECCKGRNH